MRDEPQLYGIMGYPLGHTLSPVIHNALFKRYRIRGSYFAFPVREERLPAAINCARIFMRGFNVTMPHKEALVPLLDELSEDASNIRSVNTVVNKNGKLVGYNTDGVGARKALERVAEINNSRILVLGAGGAGKAIAYELSKFSEVIVLNRTMEKALSLQKFGIDVGELTKDNLRRELKEADILINATSVGMNSNDNLVPREFLRKELIVMDIVYHPLSTKLLKDAEKTGCTTVDGLWMLVYQGAESFRLWTGIKVDISFMRRIAIESLRKSQ